MIKNRPKWESQGDRGAPGMLACKMTCVVLITNGKFKQHAQYVLFVMSVCVGVGKGVL